MTREISPYDADVQASPFGIYLCEKCQGIAPLGAAGATPARSSDIADGNESRARLACYCGACEVPHARLAELHGQYPENKVVESMIRNRVWAHTYEAAPDAWAALSYLDDMRFMVAVLLTLPDEIPAD